METPAPAPVRPSGPRAAPLDTFEWLLIGFLLVSGTLRLVRGWGPSLFDGPAPSDAWEVLVGTFSLLLAGQVFLRTPTVRFSIAFLFLIQIAAFVVPYTWIAPERWIEASRAFRLQRLAELAFLAAATVLLLRPRRRETTP